VTTSPSAPHAPGDSWESYGRSRVTTDAELGVGGRLHWDWYQRLGPGAELLGDLTDLTVAELGAGAGRQAAHVAASFPVARVVAIDSSTAQHEQGVAAYGHLPHLTLAHADATTYLSDRPGTFDVCFSVFGAIDFTDPHALLPAIHTGLRPGGRLVFSTLAHYRTGRAPESEARPATISAGTSERGTPTTMQRWVLDTPVWEKLLDSIGFTVAEVDTIRDPGSPGQPPMVTTIIRAQRSPLESSTRSRP